MANPAQFSQIPLSCSYREDAVEERKGDHKRNVSETNGHAELESNAHPAKQSPQLRWLSNHVEFIESQAQRFNIQIEKIQRDIASAIFPLMMAERQLKLLNWQTPPSTPVYEDEPNFAKVPSIESLLERMKQANILFQRVVHKAQTVEQTLEAGNLKLLPEISLNGDGPCLSRSSSGGSQEDPETKLDRKVKESEAVQNHFSKRVDRMLSRFNVRQIMRWEEAVFSTEEAQELLKSSLEAARIQHMHEQQKAGLRDFTPIKCIMEEASSDRMAAVSCESIAKVGKSGNQDSFFFSLLSIGTCYGVCDGHGTEGKLVAKMIAELLPVLLKEATANLNTVSISDTLNAIRKAFRQMDERLTAYKTSGSTLTCAIETPLGVIFANIGDSRAILDIGGKALQCTADQSTNDPFFVETVKMRGAVVKKLAKETNGPPRVFPALTMITADMGNHQFYIEGLKLLSSIPEVTFIPKTEIQPGNTFLIIASDGLWAFASTDQAVATFRERLKLNNNLLITAQDLATACFHAGKNKFADDTTVMIVRVQLPETSS